MIGFQRTWIQIAVSEFGKIFRAQVVVKYAPNFIGLYALLILKVVSEIRRFGKNQEEDYYEDACSHPPKHNARAGVPAIGRTLQLPQGTPC
jgi:hypothetical protein